MSRFFQNDRISPYVPGEQPKDRAFVKLNTNESPFPPYEVALQWGAEKAGTVNLYSDPTAGFLRRELAHRLTLRYTPELVFVIDDSISHGVHISAMLQKLNVKDENADDNAEQQ